LLDIGRDDQEVEDGAMAIPWPPGLPTDRERSGRRAGIVRLRTAQRRRKILETHQELPGRVHVVFIRQSVGV
jgi:hypothetical protein